MAVTIQVSPWGQHLGREVWLVTMRSPTGSYVELTNLGATVVSVVVPDHHARLTGVVLGFPSLAGYLSDTCYLGRTVGRVANRISHGTFCLNGIQYRLDKNDHGNTNHSGAAGFHNKVFGVQICEDSVVFRITSPHGEGGFPGHLDFTVTYSWNDDELKVQYQAVCDQDTIANFTNHTYFNLSGCGKDALHQHLQIQSDAILESTRDYLPTGNILPAGSLTMQGQRLRTMVNDGRGINAYYIRQRTSPAAPLARLASEVSRIRMEVYTTYPGLMLYSGDFLETDQVGNHGYQYGSHDGICLECHFYPAAPNHQFPSIPLAPGELYDESISFKFDTY